MQKLIFYRLLSSFGVLFLVATLLFALVQLSPIDPVTLALGDAGTPEQQAAKRHELGLDRALPVQFVSWLGAALTGDLGKSHIHGAPVIEELLSRLPVTFGLVGGAILLSIVIGLLAGVYAGFRADSVVDRAITFLVSIGLALPGFWLGLLFASAFAVSLRWFPAIGYTPLSEGLGGWLRGLALPCTALAIHAAAVIARHARGAIIESSNASYVQALRANGTPERLIRFQYILKNAMTLILPIIGIEMAVTLATSVVIEKVFALPGIGTLLVESIVHNDLPLLQGSVLLVACFVLLANLLIDVALGLINPRVRPS